MDTLAVRRELAEGRRRIGELEAQVVRLRAALGKYGTHWHNCPATSAGHRCRCGWGEVKALVNPQKI